MTKHECLYEELKRGIASGQYDGAGVLPSEYALVSRYGVSRSTVQRALRDLERAGLIRKQQRKGAFVVSETDRRRFVELKFPEGIDENDVAQIMKRIAKLLAPLGLTAMQAQTIR